MWTSKSSILPSSQGDVAKPESFSIPECTCRLISFSVSNIFFPIKVPRPQMWSTKCIHMEDNPFSWQTKLHKISRIIAFNNYFYNVCILQSMIHVAYFCWFLTSTPSVASSPADPFISSSFTVSSILSVLSCFTSDEP